MPPRDLRNVHTRRFVQPNLEWLEDRIALANPPLGPALPGVHFPAANVAQFAPVLYPPGTPQPTAAEIQRESFVAKGVGRYTVGPGRFGTQSITIHGNGKPTTTNQSLKGHFQYNLFEPTNPSQSITGVMSFIVQDFLASGGELILDLQGPTGSEVNIGGVNLPTHAFWARDSTSGQVYTGAGSGVISPDPTLGTNGATYGNYSPTTPASFSNPNPVNNYFTSIGLPANPAPGSPGGAPPTNVDNWNLGFGDAAFKYIPDAHPQAGTLGSGTVIISFRGLINYSGAQSPQAKNYM